MSIDVTTDRVPTAVTRRVQAGLYGLAVDGWVQGTAVEVAPHVGLSVVLVAEALAWLETAGMVRFELVDGLPGFQLLEGGN